MRLNIVPRNCSALSFKMTGEGQTIHSATKMTKNMVESLRANDRPLVFQMAIPELCSACRLEILDTHHCIRTMMRTFGHAGVLTSRAG